MVFHCCYIFFLKFGRRRVCDLFKFKGMGPDVDCSLFVIFMSVGLYEKRGDVVVC